MTSKGAWYQNKGARFPRDGGNGFVERGEVFQPTENELKRRLYKLIPTVAPVSSTDAGTGIVEGEEAASGDPRWPLRMAPETYLKLHPEGEHAPLAREIVGEPEEVSDGDSDE